MLKELGVKPSKALPTPLLDMSVVEDGTTLVHDALTPHATVAERAGVDT